MPCKVDFSFEGMFACQDWLMWEALPSNSISESNEMLNE